MATRPYNYKHPFKPARPLNLADLADREAYGYVEKQLGKFDYETDFHYGINLNRRLSSEDKFKMLDTGMQMFDAVDDCIGSIFGDGMYSYFEYGSSDHAPIVLDAFRRIGAEELADVLARAMALFGPEYPVDWEQRQATMQPEELWKERFEPFNREYYAATYAAGSPIELLGHYMKTNPDRFFEG
jgi:hypothetical protein